MILLARWHSRGLMAGAERPSVHVATIDHALRAGSRAEAETVAAAARDLDLPHRILTWTGPKPSRGVQEAARAARYQLLGEYLQELGIDGAAVLTAHTADDQAETLLMRLARGSGLDGLAAMPAARPLQPGAPHHLVRPLLGITKARLLATLAASGQSWCEDPSNANTEFERVRVRAAAEALAALGLTADKIALSAQRLSRARAALDRATVQFERDVLHVKAGGAFAYLAREPFFSASAELRLRLLSRVLCAFGGNAPPPRLSEIEHLLHRLERGGASAATLGGCVIAARKSGFQVFREGGRSGLPEVHLHETAPAVWDDRFQVSVSSAGPGAPQVPVSVRALGAAAYATLAVSRHRTLPRRVAATLPAFWRGTTLLAVPTLQDERPGAGAARCVASQGLIFRSEFLGLPEDARILR